MNRYLAWVVAIGMVAGAVACSGGGGGSNNPGPDVEADFLGGDAQLDAQDPLDGLPQDKLAGDSAGDVLPDVDHDAAGDLGADTAQDTMSEVADAAADADMDLADDLATEVQSDVDTDTGCLGPAGEICCSANQECQGLLLNEGETLCQPAVCQTGYCVLGDPVVCQALDECHAAGQCDPESGLCISPALNDGTWCEAGACKSGECVNLCATVKCGSPGECKVGYCDIHTGQCGGLPGPDGLVCSIGVCQAGECVDLCENVECDPVNECNTSICNSQTGKCLQIPLNDGTYCPLGLCQGGVCVDQCAETTCPDPAPCYLAGVCDVHTGQCQYQPLPDGQLCYGGVCDEGVCVDLCKEVVCPPNSQCELEGACDPATGQCIPVIAPDFTTCDWGSCQLGTCFGLKNGNFLTTEHWTPSGLAMVNPMGGGHADIGYGMVIAGGGGSLSQVLANVPQSLRLRATMNHMNKCTAAFAFDCMMNPQGSGVLTLGGVEALVGSSGSEMYRHYSGCLGESAYGTNVKVALEERYAMMADSEHHFDGVQIEAVDQQTCPGVGEVLNGDAQGTFGWEPCRAGSGVIEYDSDLDGPFVKGVRSGSCQEILCMTTWVSVPNDSTMGHPVLRFDYISAGSSSGGYNFIVQGTSWGIEYLSYDSATWKSAQACIGASLQGRAERVRFSRGGCSSGVTDTIQLRNVRIEDDPVACP